MNKFSSYQVATAIALFFHSVGLIGILFTENLFFVNATPLNLLLSFALLLWTQQQKNTAFFVFMVSAMVVGFFSEVIGVNTGMLFGNYRYGMVLGPQVFQVPLLIAVNWFIIIYCAGTTMHLVLQSISNRLNAKLGLPGSQLKMLSVIVDGATLAVLFDWLMEPIAIRLGYWTWMGDGSIPFFNYVCWFVISLLLLIVFHRGSFAKTNKFALNLLLIQSMFFLLLRTFLK